MILQGPDVANPLGSLPQLRQVGHVEVVCVVVVVDVGVVVVVGVVVTVLVVLVVVITGGGAAPGCTTIIPFIKPTCGGQ